MATIAVDLVARTAAFGRDMSNAARDVNKMTKAAETAQRVVARLGAALAGYVGIRAIKGMFTSAANEIDRLAKTADKLGMTTEALAGLRHAGEMTGVATGTLDMALQRMTRRLAEAAQGGGKAKGALAELGLSAQALARMTPDQQFAAIADAMGRVGSQSDRVRLAFKLFDSEGVALVNTLKLGSQGLQQAMRDAEALGLTISRVDAARIEAANDAMTRARQAMSALGLAAAIHLAPAIEQLSVRLANLAVWFKQIDRSALHSAANMAKWVVSIGAAVALAPKIVGAIKKIIDALKALAKGQAIVQALAGPAGWATLAVGIGIAAGAAYGLEKAFGQLNEEMVATAENSDELQAKLADADDGLGQINLSAEGATAAVGGFSRAVGSLAAEQFALGEAIDRVYQGLRLQRDTLGMSAREAQVYELRLQGATDAMLAGTIAIARQMDQIEAAEAARKREEEFWKRLKEERKSAAEALKAEGRAVWEQVRTPLEAYAERLKYLEGLAKGGGISPDLWLRAIGKAKEELDAASAAGGAGRVREPGVRQMTAAEFLAGSAGPNEQSRLLQLILRQLEEANRRNRKTGSTGLSGS